MYPFLDLTEIELDAELVRSLPKRIAYYHLAIPVAQDEHSVTVAMVHPDNQLALDLIRPYLYQKITAIRASAQAIQHQLNLIWLNSVQENAVKHWAWYARDSSSLQQAQQFIHSHIPALERRGQALVTLGKLSLEELADCDFVIAVSPHESDVKALFESKSSFLILQNYDCIPKKIVHLLRGHTPDFYALDYLLPIAQQAKIPTRLIIGADEKDVSLLQISAGQMLSDHVNQCRQILINANVQGQVKFYPFGIKQAIPLELEQHSGVWMVMAAEAHGDFTYQIWQAVQSIVNAFWVVKV